MCRPGASQSSSSPEGTASSGGTGLSIVFWIPSWVWSVWGHHQGTSHSWSKGSSFVGTSSLAPLLLLLLSRFSRVRLSATPWTTAHQAPPSWDSPGKSTGVGCHFLLLLSSFSPWLIQFWDWSLLTFHGYGSCPDSRVCWGMSEAIP